MLKVVNNTTVVWRKYKYKSPTVGPIYHRRRTTPRLPHDVTLTRQKTPASPEQHIIIITYGLFSPTEHIDTT